MSKKPLKKDLREALGWIVSYVALMSLGENLSRQIGVEKCLTAPLAAGFAAALWLWVRRRGWAVRCGLCAFQGRAGDYLYFLPLAAMASVNLWQGVALRLSPVETALYLLSMLCVGFVEEVIFRGLLYTALKQENAKRAMAVASLTFGLGHIVNLLNGAAMLETGLQLVYACAAGLLFTVLFEKGRSLIPCIAAHSAVNMLSAFSVEGTLAFTAFTAAALTAVALGYAAWIWRRA